MEQLSSIQEVRRKTYTIREHVIRMLFNANSWHAPAALSIVDILTVLYFVVMRHNPKNPRWEDRDRFILSKGHGCSALYAVLAEAGYFSKDELMNYRKPYGILQGHPNMSVTPGVEMSTGSLGQGLSIGVGMVLGRRLDKRTFRVYVLISDGESQEGQTWEAAMAAAHFKLDNLIVIQDYNKLSASWRIQNAMGIEPLCLKWQAFGWDVLEIDGHNIQEIINALENAEHVKGKPTVIIAHTVKGKGVSFMEDVVEWHSRRVSQKDAKRALEELKYERSKLFRRQR